MNAEEYIASGRLEDYCLGLLTEEEAAEVEKYAGMYNSIQEAIDINMLALEKYALGLQRQPPAGSKEKIMGIIDNLAKEEKAKPGALPLINRFSNHKKWLQTVKPLLPAQPKQDIYTKVLRNDNGVFQAVLWLTDYYPDEVHEDVLESALLLEGECTCILGDDEVHLVPGQFIEIPFDVHHNIKVTKGPVLAIIQRLKVA